MISYLELEHGRFVAVAWMRQFFEKWPFEKEQPGCGPWVGYSVVEEKSKMPDCGHLDDHD